MAMSQARFSGIFNGLTAIAQRVYGAVPISAPWGFKAIHAELIRTGSDPGMTVVRGCLRSLVESGIVTEREQEFIRVPVRYKDNTESKDEDMATLHHAPKQPPKQDACARLSALSARATKLAGDLRDLANDLETAALEIDEEVTKDKGDLEKLRNLRSVLQSLA